MQEDVFARIDGVDEEIRVDPSYYWDNSRRSESNRINLQRTLSGEAFWEDERGRQRVPAGKMMLFTHRENSRYGYPATAKIPYQQRYLSVDPVSTIVPLFNRIRRDFGAIVNIPTGSESSDLFDEVYHRFKSRSFRDRYHESELIVRLLTAIYRQQVSDTQERDPIEYGYHLLQNRYAAAITLKAIADQCGVTREHFIRAFGQRYGLTPGAFLRQLRIDHACSMLEASELPVSEIAVATGFSSGNVFCRAFRAACGVTPQAFRKQRCGYDGA